MRALCVDWELYTCIKAEACLPRTWSALRVSQALERLLSPVRVERVTAREVEAAIERGALRVLRFLSSAKYAFDRRHVRLAFRTRLPEVIVLLLDAVPPEVAAPIVNAAIVRNDVDILSRCMSSRRTLDIHAAAMEKSIACCTNYRRSSILLLVKSGAPLYRSVLEVKNQAGIAPNSSRVVSPFLHHEGCDPYARLCLNASVEEVREVMVCNDVTLKGGCHVLDEAVIHGRVFAITTILEACPFLIGPCLEFAIKCDNAHSLACVCALLRRQVGLAGELHAPAVSPAQNHAFGQLMGYVQDAATAAQHLWDQGRTECREVMLEYGLMPPRRFKKAS